MEKPNFDLIVNHARVRDPVAMGPQAVPHTKRLYKCECCNDTGVVQSWKLNRWALRVMDEPLDAIMSLPVLCTRYTTCGEVEIQVFADKDKDENAPRTARKNFINDPKAVTIPELIKNKKIRILSYEQSQYIHDRVLEYRELLATTQEGQEYVDSVKAVLRAAVPEQKRQRLQHVSEVFAPAELPPEPELTAVHTERVQVVSPRDFVPSPDPLPLEPGQEIDGITTFTNHPAPEDLPF